MAIDTDNRSRSPASGPPTPGVADRVRFEVAPADGLVYEARP